jgi:hypothetical protein
MIRPMDEWDEMRYKFYDYLIEKDNDKIGEYVYDDETGYPALRPNATEHIKEIYTEYVKHWQERQKQEEKEYLEWLKENGLNDTLENFQDWTVTYGKGGM